MKAIDTADKLDRIADDQQPDDVAEDSDDEESRPKKPKTEKFDREKGRLDKSGLYYKESESEAESSSDESELSFIEEKDEESDGEPEPQDDDDEARASPTNPLLVDLEEGGLSRRERRAQVDSSDFFQTWPRPLALIYSRAGFCKRMLDQILHLTLEIIYLIRKDRSRLSLGI